MISSDQPTCFPSNVLVRVSSGKDGTMLDRTENSTSSTVLANRATFCQKVGADYADATFLAIVYDDQQSYDNIVMVDESHTSKHRDIVLADALFTKQRGVGLFLPVADCVAVVVYDPYRHFLALVHLGRHSTVAGLMKKTIDTFVNEGSSPLDILVWMSPSAKRKSYVMQWFDHENDPLWRQFIDKTEQGVHLDLPGFNRQACIDAGILDSNISISSIDTVDSEAYFSHSSGDVAGRFAVVAMMK